MLINFNQKLIHLDGEPIKNQEKKDVTLLDACVNSLLSMTNENIDGVEKLARYKLAQKISDSEGEEASVEVTVEEISKIKKLVGMVQGPLTVGPVYQLLEGAE